MADDPIWHRVDRELRRRKQAHEIPNSWAQLARAAGGAESRYSAQQMNHWKTRGVPPKEWPHIATALGWSTDQLLSLASPATPAPKPAVVAPHAPPPPPPDDFRDRHAVSETDWSLLQDIKDAMGAPGLAKRVNEILAELADLRTFAEGQYQKRIEAAQQSGGNAGDLSVFRSIDEKRAPPSPPAAAKKKPGRK